MPAPRLYDARLQAGFAEGQVVGNRDPRPGQFTDLRAKKAARFDQRIGVGVNHDTAATITADLQGVATYVFRGKALAGAGKYNLYMDGTAVNYLAGNLMLGTTTDGMTPAGSLAVAKDFAHRGTLIGFYNATPATKPTVTGSRGGNAAVANLLTALAALGLILDSTTA
jgi:hypothetical protein